MLRFHPRREDRRFRRLEAPAPLRPRNPGGTSRGPQRGRAVRRFPHGTDPGPRPARRGLRRLAGHQHAAGGRFRPLPVLAPVRRRRVVHRRHCHLPAGGGVARPGGQRRQPGARPRVVRRAESLDPLRPPPPRDGGRYPSDRADRAAGSGIAGGPGRALRRRPCGPGKLPVSPRNPRRGDPRPGVAHRVHRGGRLRTVRRRPRRPRPVARAPGGRGPSRPGSLRARSPRHPPLRGRDAPLRPGTGSRHQSPRGGARTLRRPGQGGVFRKEGAGGRSPGRGGQKADRARDDRRRGGADGICRPAGGADVGRVTSGGKCPTVGIFGAMALVRRDASAESEFAVDVRGQWKRARARALPFYRRTARQAPMAATDSTPGKGQRP